MFVKSLDLQNFRNYETLSVSFDPGTNIIYGANAQGKTNILEAIYLTGTTKSHRGSKDRDMIRMSAEEGHIRMTTDRRGNEYRIDVHLRKNRGKGYAVGGVPLRRAADLFGIVSLVFFSPEDLNMIKNGPSGRRRFLDQILCGTDRVYLSDLSGYAKCLIQRNALLRELSFCPGRMPELDIWDQQLSEYGRRITAARTRFVDAFRKTAAEKHLLLTDGRERLKLRYEPSVSSDENFEEVLFSKRENDIRMKSTGAGPHRDDMAILANGMDLRPYGSQGQQRTAALSMKLAEIGTIFEKKKEMPVLLLDDVLSELDRERQNALLDTIRDTQTLITCTGMDESVRERLRADKVFHVKEGRLEGSIG